MDNLSASVYKNSTENVHWNDCAFVSISQTNPLFVTRKKNIWAIVGRQRRFQTNLSVTHFTIKTVKIASDSLQWKSYYCSNKSKGNASIIIKQNLCKMSHLQYVFVFYLMWHSIIAKNLHQHLKWFAVFNLDETFRSDLRQT